jgi:hypothetical protein
MPNSRLTVTGPSDEPGAVSIRERHTGRRRDLFRRTLNMTAALTGRKRRAALAGLLVAGVAASAATTTAGTASAAVPAFPDNITIFPDRDFVSVDGFADHAGQQVTVELVRAGVGVVGRATGTMASEPPQRAESRDRGDDLPLCQGVSHQRRQARRGAGVGVLLEGDCQRVRLTISDDGVGLPPSGIDRRTEGHVGLHLLRDAVADLGGDLTIAAGACGRGTTVVVNVPSTTS